MERSHGSVEAIAHYFDIVARDRDHWLLAKVRRYPFGPIALAVSVRARRD